MNAFRFEGRTGLLRSGSRVVTELRGWSVESADAGRLRVIVAAHEPDLYWWEHHDGTRLVLELDVGRNLLRGPATIIASEPLVIDMTQEA